MKQIKKYKSHKNELFKPGLIKLLRGSVNKRHHLREKEYNNEKNNKIFQGF